MPLERAEVARAEWLVRFPEGFEERLHAGELELAAYVEEPPADLPGARVAEVEPGWEENWRAFHHPVDVGPLWIGPSWADAPADRLVVVVDPGRAFGTGAHATTRLSVEWLLELPTGALLDVGCGSGVLSIAAARLGFAPITAVDVDPAAVETTVENAAANAVTVDVRLLDALRDPLPPADVVVANIALDAVDLLAARVDSHLMVTAGYFAGERPRMPGLRHAGRREAEGWAADLWVRE